jgi:hypothetical protein
MFLDIINNKSLPLDMAYLEQLNVIVETQLQLNLSLKNKQKI